MKSIKLLLCGLMLAGLFGCATHGDNLARKDVELAAPPPAVPPATNEPLKPELREKAQAEIDSALGASDPVLRANAIEAVQNTQGAAGGAKIIRGLSDPHPLVRFAAAMAAGTLQLRDAKPAIDDLINDANPSVRVAARFALHRLGDTHLSHDLEKSAQDPDRAVRANTALVLGKLGEKSALNLLRWMQADAEPAVRIQVAEAMWKLGSKDGLEDLMVAAVSQAPDDQIVGILALAEPGDHRVESVVYGKLTADYPEVALTAARAMGMLGSDAGYTVAINGTNSHDSRERALAALALGAIGRSDAQSALARLLKDSDVNVRLAAATAILELKPPARN